MAALRDEYGNPIQLTDEYGKPVELRDEHGNPMHLTGVATAASTVTGARTDVGGEDKEQGEQLRRSSSSSSSSSEDNGQGRTGKKKGLKEKIKDKLTGKHEGEGDQHRAAHSDVAPPATTYGSATSTTNVGQHPEQEKKSMMEKIKEKLPGHHEHH